MNRRLFEHIRDQFRLVKSEGIRGVLTQGALELYQKYAITGPVVMGIASWVVH